MKHLKLALTGLVVAALTLAIGLSVALSSGSAGGSGHMGSGHGHMSDGHLHSEHMMGAMGQMYGPEVYEQMLQHMTEFPNDEGVPCSVEMVEAMQNMHDMTGQGHGPRSSGGSMPMMPR
jgi:hypothetical protein